MCSASVAAQLLFSFLCLHPRHQETHCNKEKNENHFRHQVMAIGQISIRQRSGKSINMWYWEEIHKMCITSDRSYKTTEYRVTFGIWVASCEKVPNVLSRCHTKRRMCVCGSAHPSFGMTPTWKIFWSIFCKNVMNFFLFFFLFFLKIFFFYFLFVGESRRHTKRRMGAAMHVHPSFGMTMTQDIRDLFA